MITDSISGSGTVNGINRFSELTSEDFVKIMFTELSNQDPSQPQDSSKLLEQISSLRDIESNMQLMTQISDLVGENQFASAANLIGKHVIGKNEEFESVQGTVTSASVEDDKIILTLESGERVPFKNVEQIDVIQGDDSSE